MHGINLGFPCKSKPKFSGWNPSTSFNGFIFDKKLLESKCLGRGNCNKIPWIEVSLFNLLINLKRRFLLTFSFNFTISE